MTHVSIVMLACNRPKHLLHALRGWANVDYPDFDFVLVDNNSGNPEIENIASGFLEDLHLTFFREEKWHNMNVLWNKYGQSAEGDYIVFAMQDEVICGKDVLQKMMAFKNSRSSIFTYFLDQLQTNLFQENWSDPTLFPKPFTTETTAGLISHITGAYRAYWDWFGWFRSEEAGHLWLDQDLHLREVCLHNTCETPEEVYCLHQYHPLSIHPAGWVQPGYSYHTEAQARLLEPAVRDAA